MITLVLFVLVLIATIIGTASRCSASENTEVLSHHLAGFDTDLLFQYQEQSEPELTYMGVFCISYYCCEKYPHICGTGDGLTASGVEIEPGMIAVDPSVIPLGSKVVIGDIEYTATDTGPAIKGNRIDIAVETHTEAIENGIEYKEVYLEVSNGNE